METRKLFWKRRDVSFLLWKDYTLSLVSREALYFTLIYQSSLKVINHNGASSSKSLVSD